MLAAVSFARFGNIFVFGKSGVKPTRESEAMEELRTPQVTSDHAPGSVHEQVGLKVESE